MIINSLNQHEESMTERPLRQKIGSTLVNPKTKLKTKNIQFLRPIPLVKSQKH